MPPGESEAAAVRQLLERVLASPGFARNERLSRFLRVVVERHLEGRDAELKESLIGIEVFGRKPGFDPKHDSTVRSEAARLRSRLVEYYASQGNRDPVIIELPKGGYTPRFRRSDATHERTAPLPSRLARQPWLAAVLAGFAVALAALGWWWIEHKSAPIAIAVLPLENVSGDPANEYLADGLSGELIRDLSIIDGLAVRSQTSSFAFKGKPRNVREVGRQLAADYILEGSVLRAGQRLRINTQLVRVRDDFSMWSGSYDRELTHVLAVQDEISRGIVNNLRLKLGRGRRRYEASPEAYDLYLRARALPIQHGLPGDSESIAPFEQAIAKDPSFAPAYAGLASAYATRSGQFGFEREHETPKMRAAAEKAIELDPLLAEAHDALGMAYAYNAQWEESERSFRRAIELDPSRSITYTHFSGRLLLVLGRIDEALRQMSFAEKADPLSPQVHFCFAIALLAAGRYDQAAVYSEKLPAGHASKKDCLGRARLGQGRIGEAIEILTTAEHQGYLGYAYARAGRREEAEKLAAVLPDPFDQALVFAGLGDKVRTWEAVGRMATLGPVRLGRDLIYPELALIRGDPRLMALRKKVGLPE